ncbi:MAG: hypothetical protein K5776_11115 [Lachnospiraceae bacterium]|nr:hypothetical protein [Lachnospiraceae bacterium]
MEDIGLIFAGAIGVLLNFLMAGIIIAAALGMTYSFLTRKKSDFLYTIDEGNSAYFFNKYVAVILARKGYTISEITYVEDHLIAKLQYDGKEYCAVCVVKKDYTYDGDVEKILEAAANENETFKTYENVLLFINSYFRGKNDYTVMIDRKNIWKECREIQLN